MTVDKCMKCIFICVNFNGSDVTGKFLSSVQLLDEEGLRAGSLVIDNASGASDFAALREFAKIYDTAQVIRSDVNLGYFGGLNLGISNLDCASLDYIIIGNNDLTFAPDFLRELSTRSYNSDTLVIAPNVVTLDGYHQNPHCPTRVSSFRKFLYDIYFSNFWCGRFLTFVSKKLKKIKGGRSNPLSGASQFIHMGIGACYILTPAFFKHFLRLDDSVFLYGEEALLAGQVMSVQGKTFYDADLIVHHAESASLSKFPSRKIYEFMKKSYPIYKKHL